MTAEEFAKRMQEIVGSDDNACEQFSHEDIDNSLCELLIELGYEEGIKIYQKTDKWYM